MKKRKTKRFVYYQLLILAAFLILTFLNDIVDLSHYVFGDPATTQGQRIGEISIEVLFGFIVFGLEILFIQKLRKDIKVLEGLIPVCANCKKVRNIDQWESIEEYISSHSLADFTHSICPECMEKLYPELAAQLKQRRNQ